jgi:hypothetical protein
LGKASGVIEHAKRAIADGRPFRLHMPVVAETGGISDIVEESASIMGELNQLRGDPYFRVVQLELHYSANDNVEPYFEPFVFRNPRVAGKPPAQSERFAREVTRVVANLNAALRASSTTSAPGAPSAGPTAPPATTPGTSTPPAPSPSEPSTTGAAGRLQPPEAAAGGVPRGPMALEDIQPILVATTAAPPENGAVHDAAKITVGNKIKMHETFDSDKAAAGPAGSGLFGPTTDKLEKAVRRREQVGLDAYFDNSGRLVWIYNGTQDSQLNLALLRADPTFSRRCQHVVYQVVYAEGGGLPRFVPSIPPRQELSWAKPGKNPAFEAQTDFVGARLGERLQALVRPWWPRSAN